MEPFGHHHYLTISPSSDLSELYLSSNVHDFGSFLSFYMHLPSADPSDHRVLGSSEVEVQARLLSWGLVSILPLMFCRGFEVESWLRL